MTKDQKIIRAKAGVLELGARIGVTSVLHTWGSALTHHPHVHMIVPGGGISLAEDSKCQRTCAFDELNTHCQFQEQFGHGGRSKEYWRVETLGESLPGNFLT